MPCWRWNARIHGKERDWKEDFKRKGRAEAAPPRARIISPHAHAQQRAAVTRAAEVVREAAFVAARAGVDVDEDALLRVRVHIQQIARAVEAAAAAGARAAHARELDADLPGVVDQPLARRDGLGGDERAPAVARMLAVAHERHLEREGPAQLLDVDEPAAEREQIGGHALPERAVRVLDAARPVGHAPRL